jgi:hypothetical protein
MNISKLESGLKDREDPSIIETSLYNHRNVFKKNRSNSITKADVQPEEPPQQQPIKLGLKLYSQKKPDKSSEHSEKKPMTSEKMSLNNDLQNLLSAQKKIESMDKNAKMKITNPKTHKFFLNNSFKSVQFNNAFKKSNTIDSNSKRSPSISNSGLPTDIPSSLKVTTGRPKGALLNTQKVIINNKDKVLQMKYGFTTQLTSFSDYKALNQYKTSVETYAKFIPNIRYPYYFVDFLEPNAESDPKGNELFDEARADRATGKNFSKWKEEMRRKLEGKRNRTRVNSSGHD